MRLTSCSAALAASVAVGSALTIPNDISLISERGIDGLPDDHLITNCVSVGFLPSDGSSSSAAMTMADINLKLGAKASTYGVYAQIRSSSFDGSQLTGKLADIKASGAVFQASVMPSIPLNQITAEVAQQVAAVMKKFTDEGIEVWLRFGHEVNWYVTDGTYHGSAPEFIAAWKNIYAANCANNEKVKCFWSPNRVGDVGQLAQWWPGKEYVDIVGIDCYPTSSENTADTSLFDKLYGSFYDTYAKANNLPFAIGETGAGAGQKENWLKQLVSQDHSKYPNYVSMSWFEYDKEADFRIVETDAATLQQTKQILLSGAGSCSGDGNSGNGTTTATATATAIAVPTVSNGSTVAAPTSTPTSIGNCDWGCWGWDCSATVPCQQPWGCKGGYCK